MAGCASVSRAAAGLTGQNKLKALATDYVEARLEADGKLQTTEPPDPEQRDKWIGALGWRRLEAHLGQDHEDVRQKRSVALLQAAARQKLGEAAATGDKSAAVEAAPTTGDESSAVEAAPSTGDATKKNGSVDGAAARAQGLHAPSR